MSSPSTSTPATASSSSHINPESKSPTTRPHPFKVPSPFPSHFSTSPRSPILSLNYSVSCSQSLVSALASRLLSPPHSYTALETCLVMASCLAVIEPCSTGIGGDMMMILYDAKSKLLHGINGSGRSPKNLTSNIAKLSAHDMDNNRYPLGSRMNIMSPHCITVPGAIRAWYDALNTYGSGKIKWEEILSYAIDMAEGGVPIGPVTAHSWGLSKSKLSSYRGGSQLLLEDGNAPSVGTIWKNKNLGQTLRELQKGGADEFYKGKIADKIVELCQAEGSLLTKEDLIEHKSELVAPICIEFEDYKIHELAPNGQGLIALIALNIIKNLPWQDCKWGSALYFHQLIEVLRLAFADGKQYICDPNKNKIPVEGLLSKEYGQKRAKLIDLTKASENIQHGSPEHSSSTVSFGVIDTYGNACSFINSNFHGFGSCRSPANTGFTLHNRGADFTLIDGHPNVLEGGKRPFHTIIPGMITDRDGNLVGPFSCMGGTMQPQGHVMLVINTIVYGMNPQEAIDATRFCIEEWKIDPSVKEGGISEIYIEDSVNMSVVEELRKMGHKMRVLKGYERAMVGKAQMSWKDKNGVIWTGSDGRADGQGIGG